jgi:N utilization substance protein B
MTRVDAAGLHRARAAALQILYQWEVGRVSAHEAIVTYWPARDPEDELPEALQELANGLVRNTIDRVSEIDTMLARHAQNWRVERMAVIDRLVLRLAVGEMLTSPDTPARDPEEALAAPLQALANDLVRNTIARVSEIDAMLARHAQNWRVERMAVIDRLVLRLAVSEMLASPDTPPRVVINEAIELARAYSGDEAVGFVNGILDAVRKELRLS